MVEKLFKRGEIPRQARNDILGDFLYQKFWLCVTKHMNRHPEANLQVW